MKRIVLLRHGQSQWNLENRFTGWTDVDLTAQGEEEARKAGALLKKEGFKFGMAYTSYLKRAIKTLNNVLDTMNEDWIPVQKSWRLNEKHYGMLQGLNKSETAAKYGEEQVLIWRRSFDIAPDPIAEDDKERNAKYEDRYVIPTEAGMDSSRSRSSVMSRRYARIAASFSSTPVTMSASPAVNSSARYSTGILSASMAPNRVPADSAS